MCENKEFKVYAYQFHATPYFLQWQSELQIFGLMEVG